MMLASSSLSLQHERLVQLHTQRERVAVEERLAERLAGRDAPGFSDGAGDDDSDAAGGSDAPDGDCDSPAGAALGDGAGAVVQRQHDTHDAGITVTQTHAMISGSAEQGTTRENPA
jgi:hypothetical protein